MPQQIFIFFQLLVCKRLVFAKLGVLFLKVAVKKLKMPSLLIFTCKTQESRHTFTAQGKGILIFAIACSHEAQFCQPSLNYACFCDIYNKLLSQFSSDNDM
jgi:hypothetical protein